MDIKPTNIPAALPNNDSLVSGRATPSARELDSGFDVALDAATNPAVTSGVENLQPDARPIDAGETRIDSDPWLATGSTSRMLTGAVPSEVGQAGETISQQNLADAVRGAVNLIFSDGA